MWIVSVTYVCDDVAYLAFEIHVALTFLDKKKILNDVICHMNWIGINIKFPIQVFHGSINGKSFITWTYLVFSQLECSIDPCDSFLTLM